MKHGGFESGKPECLNLNEPWLADAVVRQPRLDRAAGGWSAGVLFRRSERFYWGTLVCKVSGICPLSHNWEHESQAGPDVPTIAACAPYLSLR
jgi:hypothetical protein